MNTMADGARDRCVAQIGEALFGQPGLTLMELAEKVKGMQTHPTTTALGFPVIIDPTMTPGTFEIRPPSPAGQGDALPPIRKDEPLRGDEPIGEQHDARMFNRGWNACREAAAALAASQPVCKKCKGSGEGVAMAGSGPDVYEVDADCTACDGTGASAVKDSLTVGGGQEPIGYLYDWTHSSALGRGEEVFTAFTTDIEVARGSKGGVNIRPVYAAPPAQGVELARARVKIAALELQLATYEASAQAVDLGQFRALAVKFDGLGDEEVGDAYSGPYYECARQLRALIYSQAVGQEPFGWWLTDENGHGYLARNPGQGVIDAYQERSGCSATSLYVAPDAQAVDLGSMPEGWRLSKKATCYQLSHGNDIVGNLIGPDAEENAAIIARVLDSKAVGK